MSPADPKTFRWRAWRVLRPVLRPIAWRLRDFLVGPLHDEVRALRAELATLREREEVRLDERIADVMEQALLTLALDREARREVAQNREERP